MTHHDTIFDPQMISAIKQDIDRFRSKYPMPQDRLTENQNLGLNTHLSQELLILAKSVPSRMDLTEGYGFRFFFFRSLKQLILTLMNPFLRIGLKKQIAFNHVVVALSQTIIDLEQRIDTLEATLLKHDERSGARKS